MDFYNIMTQFINHSVELHFSPIRIIPKHTEHQNRANSTRVAWRVFITARQFIEKPRNWVAGLWRLAVPGFTARRFLREPRISLHCHICRLVAMNSPPGGFWKFSRNVQFHKNLTYIHSQWFMLPYRISKYIKRSWFSSPNLVFLRLKLDD